jgi:translation initiation factor 5B
MKEQKSVKIRQPIVSVLGHVDHGKTSLLDYIRGTAVAKAEPGLITQYISASFVPADVIKNLCGNLLKKFNVELSIPGLLFIDSPGHEAFTTLRKRGGSIADIAILVVDVNEGFRPQTDESLNFLKQFKTPFIVAATKIDKIFGWYAQKNACFLDSFKEQSERAQNELEEKIYNIIGALSVRGFDAERYDRIKDFSKQVAVIPVSSVTGEGVSDLLVILAGLAQKYLKDRLEIQPGEGKGTVLEVKEFKGLGMTIDVVLYDGEIRKGDYLIIGGEEIIKTRVKALLEPNPLKDLKEEKDFRQVDSVSAAAGIKIAAPDLDKAVAGMPLRAVRNENQIERAIEEIQSEIEEVEIDKEAEGAIMKADTLGSLEALIKSFKGIVPVKRAKVGNVTKFDVMEVKNTKNPVIFAFGIKLSDEIKTLARDNNVKIFSSNVIYQLIDDYKNWKDELAKKKKESILKTVTRPGRMRILKGCTFRQSKPAIFGVEVLKGTVRPDYKIMKNGEVIGKIKEIQMSGKNVDEIKSGERAAVCMPDVIVGKHVEEGDILENYISEDDLEKLKTVKDKLRPDEIELLEEITSNDL